MPKLLSTYGRKNICCFERKRAIQRSYTGKRKGLISSFEGRKHDSQARQTVRRWRLRCSSLPTAGNWQEPTLRPAWKLSPEQGLRSCGLPCPVCPLRCHRRRKPAEAERSRQSPTTSESASPERNPSAFKRAVTPSERCEAAGGLRNSRTARERKEEEQLFFCLRDRYWLHSACSVYSGV